MQSAAFTPATYQLRSQPWYVFGSLRAYDERMYRLKLPATSANLGPGFDSLGLAMDLYLEIEAEPAAEYSIRASGRDAAAVGRLKNNLILRTYRDLAPEAPALALKIANGIPLGMGCGSSAAALLAGVILANEFGGLRLSEHEMVEEACRREGHPDNVASCFYGGMTASGMDSQGRVQVATFGTDLDWSLLVVLPRGSLATEKARALLPASYSRADTVANVQAVALMVAAFAQGRPELLLAGSLDRMHQPYRAEVCPLLPILLPLAGKEGIFCVTLSGAGPSVLLITDKTMTKQATVSVLDRVGSFGAEVLSTKIVHGVRLANAAE